MKSKDKMILEKILIYIKELKSFINGYDQEKFEKDRKTINACVFNLSQIGELSNKISKEIIDENSQIEWQGLKALRNRIVHDYDGINLTMIWGFFEKELDELEEEISKILFNEK